MSDTSDKTALLDQLRIDRTDTGASGFATLTVVMVAIVAAALGGLGVYFTVARQPAAETASPAAPAPVVPTVAPSNTAAAETTILNASGYVTARRIATVSSQISGQITEVNVEEGMEVAKDQVLARLDDSVAQVNLRLAQARMQALQSQVETVEVNLAEARRVAGRARELRRQSLTSDADVTRSNAAVETLEANLRSAIANIAVSQVEIERQQENVDDHVVRAPFGGIVTVKNAQMGEIVAPGSAGGGFTRTGICTIVDMDSLEIEVDVNEAFIGRVFAGQQVEANLDAYPRWRIPAAVIAIIPTADRAKATVKVRIGITGNDPRILPDMGVKVAFLNN